MIHALVCLALSLLSLGLALSARRDRRRLRAARVYAEACERYPWRIAAVRDMGPVLTAFVGDELLRAWWESMPAEQREREMQWMKGDVS